jgi:hypothetical protein
MIFDRPAAPPLAAVVLMSSNRGFADSQKSCAIRRPRGRNALAMPPDPDPDCRCAVADPVVLPGFAALTGRFRGL